MAGLFTSRAIWWFDMSKISSFKERFGTCLFCFGSLFVYIGLISGLSQVLSSFYAILVADAVAVTASLLLTRKKTIPFTPRITNVGKAVGLSLAGLVVLMITIIPSMVFLIWFTHYDFAGASQPTLLTKVLFTCILAPVTEELLFRKLLYGRSRVYISARWTMFIVSICFGILHCDPVRVIPMILFSIVLCFVYEMTGHARYTIMMHMLYNVFATFFVPKFMLSVTWINYLVFFAGIILAVILETIVPGQTGE